MALRESRCKRRLMRRKEKDNECSCLGLGKDRVQLIYMGVFCGGVFKEVIAIMRSWSWLSKWRKGKAREVDGISVMDLVNSKFVVVRV